LKIKNNQLVKRKRKQNKTDKRKNKNSDEESIIYIECSSSNSSQNNTESEGENNTKSNNKNSNITKPSILKTKQLIGIEIIFIEKNRIPSIQIMKTTMKQTKILG